MKNSILCTLLFLCSIGLYAQDDPTYDNDTEPSNEVKVNALYMVIGAVDVTYERLLNEESGVGLNVFLPFDEDIKDDIDYYISPYYRLYFGKKYASGFFLEGFGLLSSVKENTLALVAGDILVNREETVTDFALGIGLGGKWVTNSGFIGEVSFGVGRNLFNSDDFNNDFVAKLGISVGYRF